MAGYSGFSSMIRVLGLISGITTNTVRAFELCISAVSIEASVHVDSTGEQLEMISGGS